MIPLFLCRFSRFCNRIVKKIPDAVNAMYPAGVILFLFTMKSCCKDAFNHDSQRKRQDTNVLQRLKHKWRVRNILQVILILCTFAIGGSICGYLGKRIMPVLAIELVAMKAVTYILMVTLLWPLCVLLVSIPLGQFSFFRKYLLQLGRKLTGKRKAA